MIIPLLMSAVVAIYIVLAYGRGQKPVNNVPSLQFWDYYPDL
jgi:hypothetical protein